MFTPSEVKRVRTKISSYYNQDKRKNRLTNNKYTDYEDESISDYRDNKLSVNDITTLIRTRGYGCHYCNCCMILIPQDKKQKYKQLTLDRLDDATDHNINNVVLACLHCNIAKAKKMYGRI